MDEVRKAVRELIHQEGRYGVWRVLGLLRTITAERAGECITAGNSAAWHETSIKIGRVHDWLNKH